MGTLYFIIKNSIVTVIVVCFLQISISGKTLEERLMDFVQNSIAPKFLGTETTYIKKKSIKMTPSDLNAIKEKIYDNEIFKGVKKNAKDLFLKEMTEVIKESQEKRIQDLKKTEELEAKK